MALEAGTMAPYPIAVALPRPSDATSDSVPKAVLALPVALVESAILPTATLFAPVVLFVKAAETIAVFVPPVVLSANADSPIAVLFTRSEERRVGKEGGITCRSRGWPYL